MEIFFEKFKSAAYRTFGDHGNNDLVQWLGSGPSIRVRVRVALSVAFIVAIANLSVGVFKTLEVTDYANNIGRLENFHTGILNSLRSVEETRANLWQFEVSPTLDAESIFSESLTDLKEKLEILSASKPKEIRWKVENRFEQINSEVKKWFKFSSEDKSRNQDKRNATAVLALAFSSLARELGIVGDSVHKSMEIRREKARMALMQIGRDQLLLLLVLLFAMPVFVFFISAWAVSPLRRLHTLARRIRDGQLRDFGIVGKDEVSQVSKALKKALIKIDVIDRKKSAKIFEIRNVLRSVIGHVESSVLIVDRGKKVNYVTPSAAQFLSRECHQINGKLLDDVMSSKVLLKSVKRAFEGDSLNQSIDIIFNDKSPVNLSIYLSAVHNREGDISRVIIFFKKI